MLSLEGRQLGNYDVIKRIRVGGMGAVYEGRQRTAFDRRVAIKVILGDHANDRAMQRRFAREAQTIAGLQHPHILPLIEFGEAQGILYLVMPFVDGGTLTSYLRRNLLDLEEVSTIYQQLLDAVEYAHDKGLIHRDIKSSNVLLELRRTLSPHLYLADFGLVRTIRQNNTLQAGKPIPLDQVPGTPHYMAPEQTRGIVTPLTDIYALGVLLYQMLTGTLPYNDPDEVCVIQMHLQAPIPLPSTVDASIPRELDTVISTAMAKHPEDRYCDVAELRAGFLAALHGPNGVEADNEPLLTSHQSTASALSQSLQLHTPRRVYSSSLSDRKLPEPIIIGHRLHNQSTLVAVRETRKRRERQGTTDSIRSKARVTEVPRLRQRQNHRRRLTVPILIFALILVLLIALLVSRGLGINLIPSSEIFGTTTVYVTAQTKMEENSYVLTASTQQTTPDLTTRTIPAHVLQATLTDNKTVSTTGVTTIPGTQAQGILEFTNSSKNNIPVKTNENVTTTTGVYLHLTQNILVPGRQDGEQGLIETPAIATNSGTIGNIQAGAISGICCNSKALRVSNPGPFTGGTDPQTSHYVAQADLDGVNASLQPALEQQIAQQFQKQLATNEVMASKPSYKEETDPSIPVNGQADHVQVTVKVQGSVIVYNRATFEQLAAQLLSQHVTKELGKAYKQQGPVSIVGTPVQNGGSDNLIYLSITVRSIWVYTLTSAQTKQWQQAIKGATSAVARAYLRRQPGVASTDIHLPFNTNYLPTSADQIKIVAQAGVG
ncbi:MAG TPA: protein kinase [Ktedonobacteraceae bacterium]